MDAVITIVEKVAEYTVAPIGRQLGYLIFYKTNFKELTDHVKELEGARDEIKHLVEAERRNGKEIETSVLIWLDRVDGVIQEAIQLREDPRHANVSCSRLSFSSLLSRYQLSRKAKKMTNDVVEAHGKGKFEHVGYLPSLVAVGSTSAPRGNENIETRKSIEEGILQALRDPKVSKIGVYGFGGVGKTTLVKEAAKKAQEEKLFDAVVIANVSQIPDLERIQGEIADLLGLRFEEKTVAGRAYRLCERIKREKTILVILDDVWTRLDLEKVGIPFGNEHKGLEKDHYGCKVLMTSRNLDVLREMEVQKDFRLEVLSEEETWSLFKVMAGDVDKEPSLQQIASEVAKKCAGLPVIIVTVARSLKNQDIHAWKDALNQLARADYKDLRDITYSALELSYNRLKGNEMKALFLLCAMINQSPSINDLFKYGMGLGIFTGTSTLEEARNRLHRMISSLKASCLLLENDTSKDFLKIHDTVREVAISIASRDQHMLRIKKDGEFKDWPRKELLNRCPQLFLYLCDIPEFPERLDCPNLELFWLNSANRYLKIPDSFFERMGNLQVLDITRVNLSSLPTSFCSLTNLTTLCLDQCVLENIDGIGTLKNLQILSLLKSSMVELSSEIGKLTHLRMLDLSNSGIEVIPPNIISSLTNLEELYMGNTSIKWEVQNSAKQNEKASLAELRQLSNLTTLELQIREAWDLPRDLMFEKLERYKMVIGDVWEWSDIKNVTLRTLKLKLGTDIHLEHGIKVLIKRVEILYLDEVDGVSNVLYQLNGEGFPQLMHLHIQNNAKIRHIIDSIERNQAQASFPKLETLVLHNLSSLEKICHGPLAINSFNKLRVIKIEDCNQLEYLLSFSMLKGLSLLSDIEVRRCNSMKKIVLPDDDVSVDKIELLSLRSLTLQHLQTLNSFFSTELASSLAERKYQRLATYIPVPFFSSQVAFPNLVTLRLSSLNLNKIWDYNQHSVHKLENLVVENCGGLKYLFSSSMVRNFLNLKYLKVSDCHMMEEIIATEEGNGDAPSKEASFFKLETIILKNMKNLRKIWHSQFGTLKTLEVKNCEKIVVVFPSSVQRTYCNLEKLLVTDCASAEEIFELAANETSGKEDITQLKRIILDGLPKLKQTWSVDPEGILSFHYLQDVRLQNCKNLKYLFPLSVATSCLQLETLIIKACGVKEIVATKDGSMCTTVKFVFDQLNFLELCNLNKLKRFYAGNHTLLCPSLRNINVFNCKKLELFKTSIDSQGKTSDGKTHVWLQQPLFTIEKVMPNLQTLTLNNKNASMIMQGQFAGALFPKLKFLTLSQFENEEATFPSWFLRNVYNLVLLVAEWSSFKEIFQDGRLVTEEIGIQLKILKLHQLPKLQHICKEGFQIDPILAVLETLYAKGCSSLINLVPSSVTFCHLKYLEIADCKGMKNLITSPTARSLTKLRTMKIKECNSLEEIISEKGNEKIHDIVFSSLEILELECLPRLNKFSSSKCILRFPLMEKLVVRQCPRMEIFSEGNTSTPNLRKVHMAENGEDWQWKGNLNVTIKNMFEHKVAFYSFKHLTLSQYPELKDFWYDELHPNMFSNLKSLEVQRCDFLSYALFPSNVLQMLHGLEDLKVRDCDSLETVFDVKGMKSKEMLVKQITQLKTLTLSGLSKLKHIWNEDPYEIISFGNLCIVDVAECQSLVNLFPMSLCQDLRHLVVLRIESCAVEEIVAMDEGSAEITLIFPQLTYLALVKLANLKSFYPGRHTLECPSLKVFNVYRCEAMQMFAFDHSDVQQPYQVDEIHDTPIGRAFFSVETVSPNLEQLALNGKDMMRILNGHWQENFFHKVEFLRLQCFDKTPFIFLNDFLEIFPNLVTLQVRNSYFETLFPSEGIDHHCIRYPEKMRNLWLLELEQLKYIWHEASALDQLAAQNLEDLGILNCPNLISLGPPSISFKNLTQLEVQDCNGLICLITSLTAKSLLQLRTLKIQNCEMIENVVKADEEEAEEDIIFENLEYLDFTSLSNFKSFCCGKHTFIFPSLVQFVLKGCSKMKKFSPGVIIAPLLAAIEVENGEKRWKDSLNVSIEQLFIDKEISHSDGN